jgi:TatD DNase family protein
MLVDSHCHLDRVDLKPYAGEFRRLMEETQATGVGHMLCVCIDLEHYTEMRDLVEPYPQVSVSVGVHPNERGGRDPAPDELAGLAKDARNVAIGETGLDYYRCDGEPGWQQQRFRNHIRAAREVGKPVIIHSRAAREDTIAIASEEKISEVGGIMHCFAEDWETASHAIDLGLVISFSGIITFKNAEELRVVARQVPDDALLVETDSPYLAPVPHRGKPNHPAWVRHVAEKLAKVRDCSYQHITEQTTTNFNRLFGN